MKDNLMNLLKNARNVVERRQFLFVYLSLVDSVEEQAEDLATIVDSLFSVADFYKNELTKSLKAQEEDYNKKLYDNRKLYDGMTRQGDDGTWERYDANVNEWYVPMHQWYDEDNEVWRNIRELDSEEIEDYE